MERYKRKATRYRPARITAATDATEYVEDCELFCSISIGISFDCVEF